MKIAIYTAITSGYDELRPAPKYPCDGAATLAFVEGSNRINNQVNNWQFRPIHSEFRDPNRNAKIHKVLSHKYLGQFDYSLWIDGNFDICFNYSVAEFAVK